jgi:hypothetical protein
MPTPWKESSMAHKTTIQFCSNTYLPLQKLAQKMQKAYCLAIITISMVNSSPLFNIVNIWEILQSIILLCKHVYNKWWVGSKPIPKL